MRQPLRSALVLATLTSGLSIVPACGVAYRPYYDPGGSGVSIDEFTYWSEPHMPQTVELLDLRTGETLFAVDIPPRQQLVVKFVDNHSEKDAWMPDLMKWELMPRGTKRGKLDNSMPVPPSFSRRLDVAIRETPEQPNIDRYDEPKPAYVAPAANAWEPAEPAIEPAMKPAVAPMTEPAVEPANEPIEPAVVPMSDPEPLIDLPDDPAPASEPGQMTPVPR